MHAALCCKHAVGTCRRTFLSHAANLQEVQRHSTAQQSLCTGAACHTVHRIRMHAQWYHLELRCANRL